MRRFAYALALVATPVAAETYGPNDPLATAARTTTDQPRERVFAAVRRDATRREVAFQVLNLVDAVQTADCLRRDVCREGNPLYGRNPSTGKLLAVKGALGVLHWVAFSHLRKTDPYAARRFATWSVVLQGGVVVANARFSF